jgi:hypothetical protein
MIRGMGVYRQRAFLYLACALPALAHDPFSTKITWSREVCRIVYAHCTSCHRDGGTSFPLTSHGLARPWAAAMKKEVLERRMPPWGAVRGFGDFRNDDSLTQTEMDIIAEWVEGGAPEGDPALLPRLPPTRAPDAGPPGAEIALNGHLRLSRPVTVLAIRPQTVPEGASLQVIARRPDGGIEPVLWLYQYSVRFSHTYIYRQPLSLPAGTVFEQSPPDAGALTLIVSADATSKPAPAR